MVSLPEISRISNRNFVSLTLPFPDQAGIRIKETMRDPWNGTG